VLKLYELNKDKPKGGSAFYKMLTDYYIDGSKYLQDDTVNNKREVVHKSRIEARSFIKNNLIPFLREKKIESIDGITTPIFSGFKLYLQEKGIKDKTINNRLNYLIHILVQVSYMDIIGITNAMYVNALNFILSHEFAHAKYRLFAGTKEDEEKADYEATQLLLNGSKDSNDFGNKEIRRLLGLGADMLLGKCIQSRNHPDTDKRIFDYIVNLGITDEINEVWALACVIYAYWDNENIKNLDFLQNNLFLSYKQRFINLINQ